MRICDRCKNGPVAMVITNSKDGIHYDLCSKCQDEFFRFMKIQQPKDAPESTPWEEKAEEPKKKPGWPKGKPRKNVEN